MSIASSLLFVVIPILLIALGIWLFRSSYQQPTDRNQSTRTRQKINRRQRTSRKTPKKSFNKALGREPDLNSDAVLGLQTEVLQSSSSTEAEPLTPEQTNSETSPTTEVSNVNYPEMINLYLLAETDHPYTGYELLQELLSVGFRYGEMNIFHRHENKAGQGKILFSLASATAPGTFELSKMGSVSVPGLCLVMRPKKLKNPVAAYDLMISSAQQLVEDLGGAILDETRRPLNQKTIDQTRELLQGASVPTKDPDLMTQRD